MRLLGVLTLAGLGCCLAADASAQPGGVPTWQSEPAASASPAPPPMRPVYAPPPAYWGPPPRNVTGAEGESSPAAAGWIAAMSTLVPVGIGFTMTALVEDSRDEGGALVAGLALVGLGAVVGPSTGHFYAGEAGRGLATTGLRLLAFGNTAGFGMFGLATMFGSSDNAAGWMLFGLAGVSAAGGFGLMVYDLVDAPSAARRANREDQSPQEDQAAVPDVTLGPAGGSLTWTF